MEDLSKCVERSEVLLTVRLSDDETIEAKGQIVFVGREVDPVNHEVLIRAEIPNENLQLLPGMDGELTVLGKPMSSAGETAGGGSRR